MLLIFLLFFICEAMFQISFLQAADVEVVTLQDILEFECLVPYFLGIPVPTGHFASSLLRPSLAATEGWGTVVRGEPL